MIIFKKLDDLLEAISYWGLIISVSLMLVLSLLTIFLRWAEMTFFWMDPLVRHLVFLSAFLGGSLATSKGQHIRIDILAKVLEQDKYKHLQIWHARLINFICSGIVLWLIKASYEFVMVEQRIGKEVFLGVHSSYLVGIIPFGLSIICYRFFYLFISSFTPVQPINSEVK